MFLSFGAIFISFCVTFHILLPNSSSFGKFDDTVIKVLSMLMGELDFTANFIKDPDSGFIAKLFFLFFLVMMTLVLMNLLLGLAVSDIGELERISKIRRAIVESKSISMMETIVLMLK